MIISSDKLREHFAGIWPDLKFIVLSDPAWAVPRMAQLQNWLQLSEAKKPPYIEHLFECEEFALKLVADQREQAAAELSKLGIRYNWPLGIVFGTRFGGQKMDHWKNICLTDEGLVLIEPQTNAIAMPTLATDRVDFLIM